MDFHNAFSFAKGAIASSSHDNSGATFPWEKGPFAAIFSDDHADTLNQVSLPEVPLPKHRGIPSGTAPGTQPDVESLKLRPDLPTLWKDLLPSDESHDSDEGLRHLAIARFINIIGSFEACGISQSCESMWELQSSFAAALAMKSTNTLVKRSLDLKRYSDWCTSQDIPILPFQERSIFKYLSTLALTSAPSGPLSVLQAITFSIHVLSCKVAFPHATNFPSQRIKGLCHSHRASGDVVNHAKPLSVAQICHLETLCATAADPYQTLVFGTILVALYARARWHDIQAAQSIQFDPDTDAPEFIELPSRKFKTANVLARRSEFLPITAVCFSISQQPWISSYICAREHFSLTIAGKLFQPLLPQMIRNDLSIHELPSRVITKLLRRLFRDDDLRAHSLKHTLLSFAAKRGLPPHVRKLLGYHLDRSEVSLATYSRDMLSDPLRQLSVLLLEIQHGTFQPDNTRSGYIQPEPPLANTMPVDETLSTSPTELFTPDENFIAAQQDSPPDLLCSPSDSDSDASSDLSQFDEVEAHLIPPPPDTFSSNSCYDQNLVEKFEAVQHRQSYRLHLIHDSSQTKMLCGRLISPAYVKLADWPSIPFPSCSQCFASKAVGAFDEDS